MMTEDDLRDRLRDASTGFAPRGDLLESLADGHARKYKRVRRGVVGGSVATTALVITVLATVFTSGPLPEEVDPATLSQAEIIEKARQADASAQGKIMNLVAEWTQKPQAGKDVNPAAYNRIEGWVLRSERRGRMVVQDYSAILVTADQRYVVDLPRQIVMSTEGPVDKDVVSALSPSGTGDPARALANDRITVVGVGTEIHLRGTIYNDMPVDIWLDSKTFLPKRSTQGVFKFDYKWLPATEDNLKKLTDVVPPEFKRETIPPIGTGGGAPTGTALKDILGSNGGAAVSSGTAEVPPSK